MFSAIDDVVNYYNKTESRLGYQLFLRGTKHFGLYGPSDHPLRFDHALRRMEDRLAEELALPAGSTVLDAGCGMGDVASRLADVHGLSVTGVDLLSFHVAEARRRVQKRGLTDLVTIEQMDYADLRFQDVFDGAYTIEALVHAVDPLKVLQGLHRAVHPDGRIALFEYSRAPAGEMSPRAARIFRTVSEVAAMPAFHIFDRGVLEALIRKAGFREVRVTDITARMLPMLRIFAAAGLVPYRIGTIFGRPDKVINAMSAVEFWKYRRHFTYNIYTATR